MKPALLQSLWPFLHRPGTITLADRARDSRRWSRAARLYHKALRRDGDRADIWIQYGHMLKEMGRLQKAEEAYRTAVRIEPANADAHLQLDHLLKRLGHRKEADSPPVASPEPQPPLADEVPPKTNAGKEGRTIPRKISDSDLAALLTIFDEAFYLRTNPDVAAAKMNPVDHFIKFGARERRDPSKEFPTEVYVKLYPQSLEHPRGPIFEFLELPAEQQEKRLRTLRVPPVFRLYPVANGVFLVVHEPQRTGGPLIAMNLLRTLVRECQLPVVTILLNSSGPLKPEFAKESVEVIEYDTLLRSFDDNPNSAWDEIARRLATRRITHGICNTVLGGQAIDKLSAHGCTCLALVHELTDSILGYGWDHYAECIATQAQTVVFPAAVVRDRFIERFGRPRGNIRVIGQPPNLRTEELRPSAAAESRRRLRAGLGLQDSDFLVLSVGTGDFRKGIDLFLQTAKAALERSRNKPRRMFFAWLGDVPRDPALWIDRDLGASGCADRMLFLGPQVDGVADYYLAADIFFLSSREDPFPTVVIEALHAGLPIVAFAGSGGVAEQIGDDAGFLVPYADWSKAAEIVVDLSLSDLVHERAAARARARTFNTPESYAADLLNLLQFGTTRHERMNERPRTELVGVGIPAYECAPYIEERLWSIFEQTLLPAEVFIVDDASTDATMPALNRLKQLAPCPIRIVENVANSGSPFRQWKRCLEETEREFVWIAESDDSARLRFLETLVPQIANGTGTNLVYANTATIDIRSRENSAGHNQYLRSVAPLSRWERSYLRSGLDEISEVLAFANTIPNVSGCLIRRPEALRAIDGVTRYRTAGDWIFYLNLLRRGRIAYCHERLNLHRRHATSAITRLEPEPIFHIERAGAHMRALSMAKLGPSEAERMIELQNSEYRRLVPAGKADAGRSYLDLMQRWIRETAGAPERALSRQRILVILPDLHVGGGQMAGIRIANAIAKTHYVWVYVVDHSAGDGSLATRLDPRLGLLPDGDFAQLLSFLEAADIQLIHSHVWWSDKLAYHLKRERPQTRWVITMHGCYERILDEPDIDLFYQANVVELLSAADGIAYLAEKNLAVFEHFKIPVDSRRMRKIYNGLELPEQISALLDAAPEKAGARSFVMVGRGIEEKGWREAATALQQVNSRLATDGYAPICLTFVGSGDFLTKLKQEPEFADLPIHYVEAVDDVLPILVKSDVGLLPSFFPQESLPTVVAEYLLCRVPAIVTKIGEAPAMLNSQAGEAGIVIGFSGGRADVAALASAMYAYATKPSLFAEHRYRTTIAAKKFSVERMLREYSELAGVDLCGSGLIEPSSGHFHPRVSHQPGICSRASLSS